MRRLIAWGIDHPKLVIGFTAVITLGGPGRHFQLTWSSAPALHGKDIYARQRA